MDVEQAVLLGVLQGITEFLPVSSSGHLVLAQRFLGFEEPQLLFDIFLHCGTLAAVCVVLRHDIFALLRRPFQKLTLFLILATAVTALPAFAFKMIKYSSAGASLLGGDTSGETILNTALNSNFFLGCAFLITSFALFAAERLARNSEGVRPEADMNVRDALLIGFLQGIAVLPGVSRSGLTLAGALGCRLERDFAARFSFLLSIPAILGALVIELKGSLDAAKAVPVAAQNVSALPPLIPSALGTFAAAITGFFAVTLMLRIVRRRPLYGFSVYTAVLGIAIIIETAIRL